MAPFLYKLAPYELYLNCAIWSVTWVDIPWKKKMVELWLKKEALTQCNGVSGRASTRWRGPVLCQKPHSH